MQKSSTPLKPPMSRTKHSKSVKQTAKQIVKQSTLTLYQLYNSCTLKSQSTHTIYIKVLELSASIWANLGNCGKDIIDFSDILNNNLILGMKINNSNMVSAFVYLITVYLNKSAQQILTFINMIKTIADNSLNSNTKYINQNKQNNQFTLACQHIPILINYSKRNVGQQKLQKYDNMLARAMLSMGKIIQSNMVGKNNVNVQQMFYHTSLRALVSSKSTKRNQIYKQLLASYFQYIDINKIIPKLDICKLTLDAIIPNQQHINSQISIDSTLKIQRNGSTDAIKNDQQITGFIIRKCCYFLKQFYGKHNFYIEQHVLQKSINKFITIQPYCNNTKTILYIYQTLFIIKKVQLLTNMEMWNDTYLLLQQQYNNNNKNKGKNNNINKIDDIQIKNMNVKQFCDFISSFHLFVQYLVMKVKQDSKSMYFSVKSSKSNNNIAISLQQNKIKDQKHIKIVNQLSTLKKCIKKYFPSILSSPYQQHIYMVSHIINNLHTIKQLILQKINRKHTLNYRQWILNWIDCTQIQQLIINNKQFMRMSENMYARYQKSNIYILLCKHYILPQPSISNNNNIAYNKYNNNIHNSNRPSQHLSYIQITKLCKQLNSNINVNANIDDNVKMYVYWDELIAMGASLLQVCVDIRSMNRVCIILKELIKCSNAVLFAHGYLYNNNNNNNNNKDSNGNNKNIRKCYKMNGLYNLLISLIKPNETVYNNINNNNSQYILSCQLNTISTNISEQTIINLSAHRNKIKSQLLLIIFKQCISLIYHNNNINNNNINNNNNNIQQQQQIWYQIISYAIAIVPQIQSQLSKQQYTYILNTIQLIVQNNSNYNQILLNCVRHVYHKCVATVLQDYANHYTAINIHNNKSNTNTNNTNTNNNNININNNKYDNSDSKASNNDIDNNSNVNSQHNLDSNTTIKYNNNNKSKVNNKNNELQFKKKAVLINYLQFYSKLYSKHDHHHNNNGSNINNSNNGNNKVLNYRRSSVYMHKALLQYHNNSYHKYENNNNNNNNKSNKKLDSIYMQYQQIEIAYNKILYIDFMYWLSYYCNHKQLYHISQASMTILQDWLGAIPVQLFIVNTINMCNNNIHINNTNNNTNNNIYNNNDRWIQLLSQCCNKLIYLSCNSSITKNINKRKQQQQTSTSNGNVGYDKINIQFQIQQASIHIQRIYMLLLPFGKLVQQLLYSKLSNYNNNNNNKYSMVQYIICNNINIQQLHIHNIHRYITCLSNIIGFIYQISHNTNHNNNNHNNNNNNNNILYTLCTYKLLLTKQIYDKWILYYIYAEMVYMGYLLQHQSIITLIKQQINKYLSLYNKCKYKNNQQYVINNDKQSVQYNIICIIQLYLNLSYHDYHIYNDIGAINRNQNSLHSKYNDNKQQHELWKMLSSNNNNINICYKTIYMLNNTIHMHPHKTQIRAISAYVWSKITLNQNALLKYQHPIVPITSATLQNNHIYRYNTNKYINNNNNNNSNNYNSNNNNKQSIQQKQKQIQIKSLWQYSSSQLQHKLLTTTLQRILQCLLEHAQLSQFRSILKLSIIYYIRSRNIYGIIFVLNCYLTRTKYINYNNNNNSNNIQQSNIPHQTSQHLPQLNLLSICDSLSSILSTIYPTQFNKKSLQKYYKLVLNLGSTNRRTSMSFHVTIESICGMLIDSMGKCGYIGVQLIRILGMYACKALGLRKEWIVYGVYAQLMENIININNNNNFNKIENNKQLHITKDSQLAKYFVIRFIKFRKQIQQKLTQKPNPQQLHNIFIQQIRQTIPYSIYYSSIIQNLLMSTIQQLQKQYQLQYKNSKNILQYKLDDKLMLQLSILMLDHNYMYKSMIQTILPISIASYNEYMHKYDYYDCIKQANLSYTKYVLQYNEKHNNKLCFLLAEQQQKILKYPLTIIYPISSKIAIISVKQALLIVYIDRYQFQDYINTVDTLISNNAKLLNTKNIDHKQWWKSRDRVDRAIGKIVNQTNVLIWDFSPQFTNVNTNIYNDNNTISEINKSHSQYNINKYDNNINVSAKNDKLKQNKISKLVQYIIKYYGNDVKKIKNIISHTNMSIANNLLQQIIIKINSALTFSEITKDNNKMENQNLLLLTYQNYTLFPFQSNSHLKNRSVYRIPSIQYLVQQSNNGNTNKIININSLKYLINSGNDLPQTEKTFYRIKQMYPSWRGIVGRKPAFREYFSLFQSDAFLYMGHGAGSQHIRERQFYNRKINSTIMLFGCSSASITQGKCQPNGIAHSHLINGSPNVLGCLWEVTDKDTDRITQNIFKTISHSPQNLSHILNQSKKKSKHQYLNGGAIVMFGMPIQARIS